MWNETTVHGSHAYYTVNTTKQWVYTKLKKNQFLKNWIYDRKPIKGLSWLPSAFSHKIWCFGLLLVKSWYWCSLWSVLWLFFDCGILICETELAVLWARVYGSVHGYCNIIEEFDRELRKSVLLNKTRGKAIVNVKAVILTLVFNLFSNTGFSGSLQSNLHYSYCI